MGPSVARPDAKGTIAPTPRAAPPVSKICEMWPACPHYHHHHHHTHTHTHTHNPPEGESFFEFDEFSTLGNCRSMRCLITRSA